MDGESGSRQGTEAVLVKLRQALQLELVGEAMERQRQQEEFAVGLSNLKRAIMEALAPLGINVVEDDFAHEPAWQPGKSIPERVDMSVKPEGAPRVTATFSREQIEDSWRSLERTDVRQVVRSIAGEYKRLLEKK
jgi:hypothetical protein